MPKKETVRLTRAGAVARLCFARPEALNALDLDTALAFRDSCRAVAADPGIRCVLITGEGRSFMVGGDIVSMSADPARAANIASDIITPLHQGLLALRGQDAPVVAALHGAVAGAGLSLALACDLAIAAEGTRLVFAYSGIGTSPDGSCSFFLPRLLGLRRAMEVALLNAPIDAAQAQDLGLVNRVVAEDRLEAEALALAERLAAGPTKAFGQIRRLFEQSFGATLAEQLEAERRAFMACARTDDFTEGCRAFREKREARFHGR